MIRIALTLFFSLTFVGMLLGQNASRLSSSEVYSKETIYLLGNNRFVKNNSVYTGKSLLAREFSVSPGGFELYKRSRRNRSIATVLSLAGGVGTITALIMGNRQVTKTVFWASLGTGAVSSAFVMNANNQINQAVWLRNKDVMALYSSE